MKNNPLINITLITLILLATGCTNLKVESIRNDPLVYAPSPTPVETDLISIEEGRFYPQIIKVTTGTVVTFANLDKTRHLVISDPHPEHDQLPDLYSNYLIEGEKYLYRFDKPGTYGVHLEDNPSVSAEIKVE
jgi:plastocyanin